MEIRGPERADGAVHETGDQDLIVVGTAFSLQEAALNQNQCLN